MKISFSYNQLHFKRKKSCSGKLCFCVVGELEKYGATRGWSIAGGRLSWQKEDGEEEGTVPSLQLANMAISYAREMEQIV